jgi:hypothetical protein
MCTKVQAFRLLCSHVLLISLVSIQGFLTKRYDKCALSFLLGTVHLGNHSCWEICGIQHSLNDSSYKGIAEDMMLILRESDIVPCHSVPITYRELIFAIYDLFKLVSLFPENLFPDRSVDHAKHAQN